MKIISLVYSAFAFAALTSIAQAEPTVMKPSEPTRLTATEMDNITAGSVRVITYKSGSESSYGSVTVIAYASGTKSSYSRSTDFSVTRGNERAIAISCCGAHATTHVSVTVIPNSPRPHPIFINQFHYINHAW